MTLTEQFPITDAAVYLNTANSGILSKTLIDWRRAHDLDFFANGSEFRLNQAEFLQGVKVNLARLFNAKIANTFLVPNFSFGFNTFLEGLSGQQRFLLLQEDYPSVNYAVQSRGFICDSLVIDDQLEENLLKKISAFKPTVLAFSIVQYISGVKIDLEFIRKLKEMFPSLLIVADGTQFCGTEYFDFERSGVDVLVSSGYKWMLAGYGNGFVFIKDEAGQRLYDQARKKPLPAEPFLEKKSLLSLYFEPGHQDTLTYGSLDQSVLFLEQLGYGFIEKRIQELALKAKNAFAERGLLDPAIATRKNHSSIFNLAIDKGTYEKIRSAGIICSPRGKGIRTAFHFYNTEQDLEKLLEVIDKHR